jgi:hypothetical protein
MRLGNRHLVGAAAAACAVCCAAPLIGLLGVAGFAATALTWAFAGVVFAVVVGVATIAALLVRRSRARKVACTAPAGRSVVQVELGPTRTGSVS